MHQECVISFLNLHNEPWVWYWCLMSSEDKDWGAIIDQSVEKFSFHIEHISYTSI